MRQNKRNSLPSFSKEEKERASNISTVAYLKSTYGFTFKFKNNYYKCEQHDSLVIKDDQKKWFWNSKGYGGNDVIEFIRKCENKSYPEALEKLLGTPTSKPSTSYISAKKEEVYEKPKKLTLPEKHNGRYSRLFAYLCETRKIDKNIIIDMIHNKQIYQDIKGNVVFVGYDEKGIAKSANLRGTLTDKLFRGECPGSDKNYTCSLTPLKKSDAVYVFESTIEAMSHATMENICYKSKDSYKRRNRISLNGLSDVALKHYLQLHPETKVIYFCLNNDNKLQSDGTFEPNKGQIAAARLMAKYKKEGYVCKNRIPQNNANDYNEALTDFIKIHNNPYYNLYACLSPPASSGKNIVRK